MQNHNFIETSDVIKIHDKLIEKYGGSSGLRDKYLLDSALAQPQMSFGGELLHPTIVEQAAAYFFHISKNHAFLDGNKRTAFAVMVTFLNSNNYELGMSDDDGYELAIKVANGEISKEKLYSILQEHIKKID